MCLLMAYFCLLGVVNYTVFLTRSFLKTLGVGDIQTLEPSFQQSSFTPSTPWTAEALERAEDAHLAVSLAPR